MVRLAVTIGDPAGIGPEVVLKALADLKEKASSQITPQRTPQIQPQITIIGSRSVLEDLYMSLRSQIHLADPAQFEILDVPLDAAITLGQESAAAGEASFRYLAQAIDQILPGKPNAKAVQFDGIVTGPIAKSAWKAAGHYYPGQTEFLAERAGVGDSAMAFVARSPHSDWVLRMLLATTHIPLRAVPDTLTPDLLTRKLTLLIQWLERNFGIDRPWIAIAGLNPHSGEQGQLGQEEQNILQPWLDAMRRQFPKARIDGLIPPDTLWVAPAQAWYSSQTNLNAASPNPPSDHTDSARLPDAYLALYHDQGLIPVKAMAFDRAVNTTLGLPFIRTSPDHGTAFDIAGRGIARAESFGEAIAWAAQLAQHTSPGQH